MTLQVPPTRFLPVHPGQPVEWLVEQGEVPYPKAIAFMEDRVARIHEGSAAELVWLLEHPPLYTAGTSARAEDLVDPERFPVFEAGRGGEYTYHGPGQRVVYVMLDLKRRRQDVRAFVGALEAWIIDSLAEFGVQAEIRSGRVGVWVRRGPPHPAAAEDKIAAIGIRLRRWVSFHGIAINVAPDLSHFSGIVPCGIREYGVTSLQDLGVSASMAALDDALHRHFTGIFGAVSQGARLPIEAAGA